MFSILELLPEPPPAIHIVDVGAHSYGEEKDPYAPLVAKVPARIVGFEPVAEELERLKAMYGSRRTCLPYVVGDGSRGTFRVCADTGTSSLYEPNMPLLDLFQNLPPLCRVVGRQEVQTVRLDDVEEVRGADYLKLDVQGGEGNVLRGAPRLLEQIVAVHTEVEFVPLYQDQPLFADIDQLLRAHGFLFHRFAGAAGRAFRPVLMSNDPTQGISQWLWADAVYVKSFLELDRLPAAKLLKLAIILHELYQSYDLCALVLRHFDAAAQGGLCQAYLNRLTGGVGLQVHSRAQTP